MVLPMHLSLLLLLQSVVYHMCVILLTGVVNLHASPDLQSSTPVVSACHSAAAVVGCIMTCDVCAANGTYAGLSYRLRVCVLLGAASNPFAAASHKGDQHVLRCMEGAGLCLLWCATATPLCMSDSVPAKRARAAYAAVRS